MRFRASQASTIEMLIFEYAMHHGWSGEHPTVSQIKSYFKKATPLVTVRGFDYDISGDTPPHLLAYKALNDTTGLMELTEDETGSKFLAMKHNQYVRKLESENVLKTQQLE